MSEPRFPPLPPELGERLDRESYKRDFRERDAEVVRHDSWKLERLQHFEEQGSASRDALRRGAWDEALALLGERRDTLLALAREDERRGSFFHRVRVVEKPLTPYLQWELHSLRQRAAYGERVRVVDAGTLAEAEAPGPLPEVVVLGGRTLYRVLYSASGATLGAIRYTEPELVGRWERAVAELYGSAEDMARYFDREVAHLPPPKPPTE
ncbi:DUF6879 family protein [Streptomyces sp. NPDC014894]|uniref:DUF6879 family protein n=1 Tax=unclassified Streptomyces TaxID=2593676 RepID=UPI0036FEBEAB